MHSQSKPKPQRITPPITRQLSKSKNLSQKQTKSSQERKPNPNRKTTPPPLIRTSTPTESQFLYENPNSEISNSEPFLISISTPESQQTQDQQHPGMTHVQPTSSENNLLEEGMETNQSHQLSDSVTAINLSGILNKTVQDTRPKPNPTPTIQENEGFSFIEAKGKRLKSALIILAKASHHKTFMETCLMRNAPPRNMAVWVQPHIYHSNPQIEKQWRETLNEASLSLTNLLIKHYSKIIQTEQETIEEIKTEITDHLKHTTSRDLAITKWKHLSKQAEDEARKLAENLKETRENKLHRKRKRTESMSDMLPTKQRQQQPQQEPDALIKALTGLLNDYSKNDYTQQTQGEKGKEPYHGRGYPRKGGPPYTH